MVKKASAPSADLQQLVADADTGGRAAGGFAGKLIFALALGWSLFQLWYASPLPFTFGWGVLNDTEARSLHLGLGLLLAFLCYPALRSQRNRIPWFDWSVGLAAAIAGSYFLFFYAELATRPGQPNLQDIVVASVGIVLLLEATRRAVGLPMTILAIIFLGYIMLGQYLPDVIAHKGASWERTLVHQWLTTEGVFGVALGVSVGYIFIFVLFGSLLDKAGAGNYMMQVSFAMLGHLRGGPAKVAVVSSGLNGLISGSSVSNVVSGGIFTIPLMSKAGYGGVKAGAIETASSVNGQIMPPVMGAAAFLMVEYVGIPYTDVIKHAFLPALISYIALFYIVHLEALKLGLEPTASARARPFHQKLTAWGLGVSGTVVVCSVIYWVAEGAKHLFGPVAAPWLLSVLLAGLYAYTVWVAARCPDLPQDIDVDNPVLPDTWPTVKAGLHFLIPIGVLIWCLMIEELSPALSAFWATASLIALMATQRPLTAVFRGERRVAQAARTGVVEVMLGLNDGARNMIPIAIATATAGIIVGGITLTGLGFRMTDFVEVVSQGNVFAMLLFTAFVCLVLGLGVPTTANYILVATLMAPVIVELGAQSDLVIPLIAVHLFVFYYGIMGDITPPVGLATFAAAAISGEDAIKTGLQGSVYALRTVVLPFVFIFNPMLLLIDVRSWWEVLLVAFAATVAACAFSAATLGWFKTRCRWWEIVLLLVGTFALFRPDYFMDKLYTPYTQVPAKEIFRVAGELGENERLVLVIKGTTIEGEDVRKTVAVQLAEPADGRKRLAAAGLTITAFGEDVRVAAVRFGSRARKSGFQQGFEVAAVKVPTDRPSEHWVYIPALGLIAFVYFWQRRRGDATPRRR